MNRELLILLPALLVAGSPTAQMLPGFNPQDVLREVRAKHSTAARPSDLAGGPDGPEFMVEAARSPWVGDQSKATPSVAFDGVNYLTVWDNRAWASVCGARVTQQGEVLDSFGIDIPVDGVWGRDPAVCFGDENYLVVWLESPTGRNDIRGCRVSPQGVVIDSSGFLITSDQENQLCPAIGFDGENWFVVWEDRGENWTSYIRGSRVTQQGTVLDPEGLDISRIGDHNFWPAVAFDGTNFLVAWSGPGIVGARVSPTGVVLDTTCLVIHATPDYEDYPAVDFDGANYLVAWHHADLESADWFIEAARVTPAGVVLDTSGIRVADIHVSDASPAVAHDGANFVILWDDDVQTTEVRAVRVAPQGTVLDSIVTVARRTYSDDQPAITFGGTGYLTVWLSEGEHQRSHNQMLGARLTSQMEVLDTAAILLSAEVNSQLDPAVAYDGVNYLVAWWDDRGDADGGIYAARVSEAGEMLDSAAFLLEPGVATPRQPAVAFDGTNYLVVWSNHYALWGARVTPQGAVLDSGGFYISAGGSAAVDFDGNWLVVWSESRGIVGCRVTSQGVVLDPSGFVIQSRGSAGEPAVCCGSSNSLVAWHDLRGSNYAIYGARVTPDAQVLDTAGFRISPTTQDQRSPAITFDGADYLVAWERLGWRIFAARVSLQGQVLDTQGIVVSSPGRRQQAAVGFDGTDFHVVWSDSADGAWGISGARVTTSGAVRDTFRVSSRGQEVTMPALAHGSGDRMFVVHQKWTEYYGGRRYRASRIWGKLGPFQGVEEGATQDASRMMPHATIVRGVLRIGPRLTARGSPPDIRLLDAAGRKVLDLQPGPNDVSGLGAGVYFVREASSVEHCASSVTKVVVTR